MQGSRTAGAAIAAVAALLASSAGAQAADLTVTSTDDTTPGSCAGTVCPTIRAAFNTAAETPEADTIHMPAGRVAQTSTLNPPSRVSIIGAGAESTTFAAAANSTAFQVGAGTIVDFAHLTIRDGVAPASGTGGNLSVGAAAQVSLDHVRLTNGFASSGGGDVVASAPQSLSISHSSIDGGTTTMSGGGLLFTGNANAAPTALTITDTTFTNNQANITGGAIALGTLAAATVKISRVTITGNRALNAGGAGAFAITSGTQTAPVDSSIVAANSPANCAAPRPADGGRNVESATDCAFTSGRQNANPGFGTLGLENGETPVFPITALSPAFDFGGGCTGSDQRDLPRPQGAACDSGAYEVFVPVPTPSATPTPTASPAPTVTPTPTPTPTPTFKQTVVVSPVKGKVLVRVPGSDQFVELAAGAGLPVGTTVDTRKGTVALTSQPTAGGQPQTANFFDGLFKIGQSTKTTDLKLTEALAACPRHGTAAAAARKPKQRHLWGDGSGSFRTEGRYSAATVRGTKWLVQDSCQGTLTRVVRGVVSVRDRIRKRTITLRKGKHYLARPTR